MIGNDFSSAFQALTGDMPLRWQERLYHRMCGGEIPEGCNLPTGLGKTSVIPIWLIALATQIAERRGNPLPRRLIYVVNRRTVVDQATTITETMRKRLLGLEHVPSGASVVLDTLREALENACALAEALPLAISTLRGEFADNEEWKADPARPAIVIGTIDMIGSKLLFSGYGDGPYRRAHHAGLVGQDSLIVHDEAHLTPAFSSLLRYIANDQRKNRESRPIQVMELSATARADAGSTLTLEPADEKDALVRQRLDAAKRMKIHPPSGGTLVDALTALALAHEEAPSRVLIYVRSPEDATKVAVTLEKKLGSRGQNRVALLTGTTRGFERDRFVEENSVYRSLLTSGSRPEVSQYLVSTSAGEVGIDLDADDMICDATTLDSMIQRFGRVNRRGGEGRVAMIDVVEPAPTKKEPDPRLDATLAILRQLPVIDGRHDASPRALVGLLAGLKQEVREAAWSTIAKMRPLTEILLDSWTLTSIRGLLPGGRSVADYLHGVSADPPETWVAWRREIDDLADAKRVDEEVVTEWFRASGIDTSEKLRDRTDRVRQSMIDLLKRHRKVDPDRDFRIVLLDERGNAEWAQLSDVEFTSIAHRTIVLPVSAGGLNPLYGTLDPSSLDPSVDVGDVHSARGRNRSPRERRIATAPEDFSPPPGFVEKFSIPLRSSAEGSEEEGRTLILFVGRKQSALDQPETTAACQTIVAHSEKIAELAGKLARTSGLPEPIADALAISARRHDDGKEHPIWQFYACNRDGEASLAKSTRYLHGRALGGYRHELGSLLKAAKDDELRDHPERDLILHLIASHHGWARPHFEPRAFDSRFTTADNEAEAHEIMRRFGRLQLRFGRWGLVWLESLLRSADIAASRAAVEMTRQEKLAS